MKIVLWTIFSLLFFPVLLLSNDCNMTGDINATVVESNNYESHIGSANIPISGEVIKRDDALVLNYIPLFNIGNLECSILEGYITNYTIEPVTNAVRGDFNGIGVCYSENGGQLILKAITIMGKVNGDVVCAESLVVTDCTGDSIECDADKCYCIKACNYETGQKDTLCIKNASDVPAGSVPQLASISSLPFGIEFDSTSFPGTDEYYPLAPVMDIEGIQEDIDNALKGWYCLCDMDGITYKENIKTSFTDNKKVFDWKERKTVAAAFFNNSSDCTINMESAHIRLNNTTYFKYQSTVDEPITSIKYALINRKNEYLLPDIIGTGVFVHSFYDVMVHEIGHIFGFIHTDDCGTTAESIMMSNMRPNVPTNGLSDYDKCGFMRFYCAGKVDIDESEPVLTPQIYPNPGNNIVTIEFTLPNNTNELKIYLINPLGNVVLVAMENGSYNAGFHSELINIEALPIGVYYVVIEAGPYRTSQSLVIAK